MRYLVVLLALMVANVAQAVDCQTVPNCTELGYTKEPDPNCKENGYLSCPFDTTYHKCVNMDCEKLGFTKEDKSSWCKDIKKCKTDENYTLCSCMKTRCDIGDVFYADGSCSKVEAYIKDSSPQPVGVVYDVTCDGTGKVINLRDFSNNNYVFYPEHPYDYTEKWLYWGYYEYEIPDFPTCSKEEVVERLKSYDPVLYDGKGQTDLLLAAPAPECPYDRKKDAKNYAYYCIPQAAQAVHDFYPPEVQKDNPIVSAGHWYLPALGELMELYGYDNSQITEIYGSEGATGDTKAKVNATLETLKERGVDAEKLAPNPYWSSTKLSNTYNWVLNMETGRRSTYNQGDHIRASLEFK